MAASFDNADSGTANCRENSARTRLQGIRNQCDPGVAALFRASNVRCVAALPEAHWLVQQRR